MSVNTVSIHYVNSVLNAAERRGLSRQQLITRSGLSQELFDSDKSRVSAQTYVALNRYLTNELQDETCGLISQRTKPGSMAMMCHSAITASNLGKFLGRCATFYGLISDCIEVELRVEGKQAYYSVSPQAGTTDEGGHIVMVMLALMQRLASWAIMKPLELDRVCITQQKPIYAKDYNLLFHSNIQFAAEDNRLVFAANYLNEPIKQTPQSLGELLRGGPMSFMVDMAEGEGLVSQIKVILRDALPEPLPTLEELAKQLHISAATVRRRLTQQGSSYKQIKDDVRRDVAIYLLSRNHSLDDVAFQSGFLESTSFFRAFKRWTGSTPKAYIPSTNHSK